GYFTLSGTSMATPEAISVAAKSLALCPSLTSAEVRKLLVTTSDARSDWANAVEAGGPINEARAMKLAALIVLARKGKSADQAATSLSLSADDRVRLLPLLAQSPAPPASR